MKHESMVIVPRRPMNITMSIVILLINVKSGVMLSESPTVENAETTSKIAYCVGRLGSKIESITTPNATTTRDENIMINARLIDCLAMVRRRISIWSRPRNVLITLSKAMANVVVLIPPAVDIGEPPIHIYRIIITTEILVSEPMLNEEKPAVRGTVARKNDVDSLPKNDVSSLSTLLYSVMKNIIVPPTTNTIVIIRAMTVLEVRSEELGVRSEVLLRFCSL